MFFSWKLRVMPGMLPPLEAPEDLTLRLSGIEDSEERVEAAFDLMHSLAAGEVQRGPGFAFWGGRG